ncbi:MAG: ATP-binding cassette domain-containing protein [Verrucomicrobiae bacterium]|nr:ATP-binding cassette domain-containing protein [Verrucomicrobiae bacterium]MCP5549663.1 ATP-binding cassette domain-containing protein [Akkermansiaceae bacterium]
MIHVENLTKRYAGRTAVDSITFDVRRGEIVGFLGPNGAGKSTTLRILTCYLSATEGSATVAGHDIFRESIKVRRKVGYMPENVPLYTDMRVREYLRFRAQIKGLGFRESRRAVEEAMDTCALQEVRQKIIGTLSKGYRQRVGLADALVNKPELLILDEPTNGLDPNQIRQARELIRQLGERHTILVSTHILSEVEMTCGRVIILDRGRIKASDTPQNLIRRLRAHGTVNLELKGKPDAAMAEIEKLPGVESVRHTETRQDWSGIEIRTEANIDLREDLFELAVEKKWQLRELTRRTASLEDAFVNLTHD